MMVIVAASIFVGGWSMLAHTSERYYKIINIAGQQRMLTQRIAYFVSMDELTPLETERLQQGLNLLKQRHHSFINGDEKLGIPKPTEGDSFHALYFGPANVNQGIQHLTHAVQAFIDSSGQQRPFSKHSNIPEQLLRKTNLAVDLYLTHGTETLNTQRSWFMLIMLMITLAVLIEVSWLYRLLRLEDCDGEHAIGSPLTAPAEPPENMDSKKKVSISEASLAVEEPSTFQQPLNAFQSEQPHPLECKSAIFIGEGSKTLITELDQVLGFEHLHLEDSQQVVNQLMLREQGHRPIDLVICADESSLQATHNAIDDAELQHDYCCIAHPASVGDLAKTYNSFCGEHKHHHVSFSDKRILLVDDNDINLMVLEGMVSKYQAQIELAHNGLQAVEKAAKQSFDLILMDLQMPSMNGYDATEKILAEEHNRKTPVVAITANHDYQGRIRCLELGMVGCEAKPVNNTTIEHLLFKYLK